MAEQLYDVGFLDVNCYSVFLVLLLHTYTHFVMRNSIFKLALGKLINHNLTLHFGIIFQ